MRFTILKINEVPLYIPSNKVGLVSVCNNKNGTEIHCFVKESIDQKRTLHIENRFDVKLISLDSTSTPSQFKLPDGFIKNINSNYSDKEETISEGIEVIKGSKIISVPFITGGVLSVMITVSKNKCTINVGGMTPDNELLDYYYSVLSVGDNISISLKNLNQISEPTCKRTFRGCDYKNRNL